MKYLIRKREFAGLSDPNPYRGSKPKFGAWVTMSAWDSLAEAQNKMPAAAGLAEWAIFHGGKRQK